MFGHYLDKNGSYRLDKSNLYGSVLALPKQIESMWGEMKRIKIGKACHLVNNIVVVGMGGSALGARVIRGLERKSLKLPLRIINDYHLPAYVDAKTLVILSSYSGTTEEVLSAAKEAKDRKAQVIVIAVGGKLAEMATQYDWPVLRLSEGDNPSGQPRMAIGMSVMAQLRLLAKCGHIEIDKREIEVVLSDLQSQQKRLIKESPFKENMAKQLAEKLKDRAVILIGAEHLVGAVHVFKNQLNENAKTFASSFDLPELNHHLLEGMGHPKSLRKNIHFILFDSELYEPVIRKRLELTQEVLVKQGYKVTKVKTEALTEMSQVWECIAYGEFVSFYLAMLLKLDPTPIPWVDYFKERMAQK